MKIIRLDQVGIVLETIYHCEINIRLEWDWDAGFVWSVLDQTGKRGMPRVMADDYMAGWVSFTWPPLKNDPQKTPPAQLPDWIARGRDERLEVAISQLAEAVAQQEREFAKLWKSNWPDSN